MDPEAVCGGPSLEGYVLTPRILRCILEVPTIAIAKVFLKFLRKTIRVMFYHEGVSTSAEAPSEVLEERLTDAAETVVAQQIGSENGNELLAPDKKGEDPIALEQPGKEFAILNTLNRTLR
jgi:hypothetical protein